MWRFLTVALFLGVSTTALNLSYLDPTRLSTIASPDSQRLAALEIITKYIDEKDVVVEIDPLWFVNKRDAFSLTIFDKKLNIKASTGLAAAWGFNYYLKKYCKSQIEWQTKNVKIPKPLPFVNETVIANDRFRYYQNVCTVSYSFVWWTFDDWKTHIEWMALNGINLALVPTAQERAWVKIYKEIGMTQEEIDQHIAGPAFLSWLRMGNVHGWGGPLPGDWHYLQRSVQLDVIIMMYNLGIVPVLPAFGGHVPIAFSRIFPNSTFHKVSRWNKFDTEYCCGLFLDPNDPMFRKIGRMFLDEISLLGIHVYAADPFNEVSISNFSTAIAYDTARAIFTTLKEFDNRAVWSLQNWMFVHEPVMWPLHRVKAFITAVPNGRMLILDLQSEQWPQYYLYKMYYGQPFIWCMLHNFGGTLGMHGNVVTINRDVYEVRNRINSTMIGIGLTPEGINQNYVVYDLMLESAWRKSPVEDLNAWMTDYAERRHGCKETGEAYMYLLKSVYSFNGLNRIRGKYVVTRRPSFGIRPWAWYKSYDLFQAFKKLIFVNTNKCATEGFKYDVTDVTRQALQYRAEQLYLNVVRDRNSNNFVFETSINRFISVFDDMYSILRVSDYFVASNWFLKARSLANNDYEAYLYEMNARNQITLWGPKGEIADYACKQWAELIQDYYRPRWHKFLSAALRAKESREAFNEKETRRIITETIEIPYTTMITEDWVTWSTPNPNNIAKELYRKWAYVGDLKDLPIMTIEADPYIVTTPVDAESDITETADEPSITTYTAAQTD